MSSDPCNPYKNQIQVMSEAPALLWHYGYGGREHLEESHRPDGLGYMAQQTPRDNCLKQWGR